MAPVAPSGWPIAIAPPLTLSFSLGMPRSFWNFSTTEAKASLSSNRSMSSTASGAVERLQCRRGRPTSMIVGSAPLVAVGHAAGPRSQPLAFAGALATERAPVRGRPTMPEPLLRGVDVVDLLHPVVLLHRHIIKPAIAARPSKAGLSLPRLSRRGVPGRMCSSWSRITRPFWSRTGTTDLRSSRPTRPRRPLLGCAPRRRRRRRG